MTYTYCAFNFSAVKWVKYYFTKPCHELNEIMDVNMLCKLLMIKVSSSIVLYKDIILSICVLIASAVLNKKKQPHFILTTLRKPFFFFLPKYKSNTGPHNVK